MSKYETWLGELQKTSDAILYEIRQECINIEILSPGATIGPQGIELAKKVRRLMQISSALDVCITQINKLMKTDGKTSENAVDGEKTLDNSIAGAV